MDDDLALLERCARLALDGIEREYPYHLTHVLEGPRRIAAPVDVHPVFRGCFDWHSAVHGHWLLVRSVRLLADRPTGSEARTMLDRQLRREPLRLEAEHLAARPSFERPYGLVWALALGAELRRLPEGTGGGWVEATAPLEQAALANLLSWLPRLSHPMRTGTHNQTAFALALLLDWAEACGRTDVCELVRSRASDYFGADRDYPLHLEPGGEDFLSPSLASAWLMSRVMDPVPFGAWLGRTLPRLGLGPGPRPVEVTDRTDGRLAHLDGLNISVAWMLEAIAGALPSTDPRVDSIRADAVPIRAAGEASIATEAYAGTHWLGTFVAYGLGLRMGW